MSRTTWTRLAILAFLVLGITALHYGTTIQKDQFHDIYRRLYYIPIVLGGIWFCLRGGLGVAIVVSILYAPHVVFQWGHHHGVPLEQYLEMLLYNAIGCLTGLLSGRERLQTQRYRNAARRLEESYDHLKAQADQILDIEQQLRRADRLSALGQLAAGMAHEIRNPLGSIRGTAEILQDGVPPEDPRHEFTRILLREVERLNGVVQDFLDFARPAPEERSPVELNGTLREVLALVSVQAEKSGIQLSFQASEVPPVNGDAEQLKQAFLNLILNAVQAMPGGGTLRIKTETDGREVRVRFADSGPGIPAAQLDQIFNPFFTTREDGTGLGLAITSRIVQGHGGRIDVQSELGRGTEFTLCLPVREKES